MSVRELRQTRSVFCFVLALGFTLFILATSAFPQGTNATLSGVVTDPSGAVMPGAEVTLTNQASGFEAKSTSSERGEYTFRNLVPGTYQLKVSKIGFSSYLQKDIVLTINQAARVDAGLKVGSQTETISVTADNTLLNYDNATVQGGIDPETLKSLPLTVEGKPRSSAALVVLEPGVTTGGSSEAFQARINGGVESGDEALMDGATMQEGFMSQSGMVSIHQDFQMSPDMVQEVKVIASNYDAQYGGSTSAQVAVVTKSGSNNYHGAIFEYNRDTALNAAQWGSPKKTVDIENNFGANFGGPIKIPKIYQGTSKHKSYFYFDWESYHIAGGSSVPTLTIPSLKERSGDFTDWGGNIYVPLNGFGPSGLSAGCRTALNAVGVTAGGQAFPGKKIPAACISPISAAYLGQLPTPSNAQSINNYTLGRAVPDTLTSNSNVYMFRIDHDYAESDKFYFTFWRQFTGYNAASALPRSIATESPTKPQNSPIMRFNWEHIFSPKMTNHVTMGYLNRNEGYGSLNLDQIGKLPQVTGAASTRALPQFGFSDGFNQLSNSSGPNARNITTRPTWVLNDIATRVIGSHTVAFGGEWRNVQGNIHQGGNESGTYNFDRSTTSSPGDATSGSPVAGFLLGAVSGGSVDYRAVSNIYPRQWVYALHANDSWKVTPKFTFNYGLRWDLYTPSREKFNHLSFIDLVGKDPTPGAAPLPGRLAYAGSSGTDSYGADFPEKTWKKGFAPRVGLAYSWDQKTVVRAGYGVFFAQAFYPGWGGGMSLDGFNHHDAFSTSGPLGPTGSPIIPAFFLDQGIPAFNPPPNDVGQIPTAANGNGSAYRPVDANRRPYSQQWNLTIERELPDNISFSVAYVGNKGTRLTSSLQPVNVLNPFGTNTKALGSKLGDTFAAGDTSKDGVPAPYPGWAQQLITGGGCAPTVAQALLPFPQFCGPLQGLNENHGNSIYHSLQLKAEKRYSRGLYMLVSYTNSKLISDASDNTQQLGGSWNATQGVISPFEKQRARSISSDDVPQVLSAAFVYDLPFGAGKRFLNQGGVVNAVVGGWQLSPLIHWSRGTPMWFRSNSCNVVAQFRQACLVGVIPGKKPFLQDPNSFNPANGPLLDVNAFEPVSNFSAFGYTGAGPRISNLRGPNAKDTDFALTKNTRLTEKLNFQLRFQFFNAFNQHYFFPATNVNNQGSSFAFNNDISSFSNGVSNFGKWNGGVSSPRTIQIAGRLEF